MTLPEIHTQVVVQFEAVAAQTLDNFLPQEIDLYLNRGIREFINQHRPLLLQPREDGNTREAVENLRTLLNNHSYASGDFTDVSDLEGCHSLPIGNLDPTYEYFVSGQLTTDQDAYNVETSTIRDFYEHLETRHNTPIFRRAKIVERGPNFLLALPDPDETPQQLELTYLGEFSRVDIELVIDYTISSNTGSNTASIEIEGVGYDVPWNTDASTTVDDFISSHSSDINQRHDVIAKDMGDTVRLVTHNPDVLESEFDKVDSSADVSLNQSTQKSRPEIPLPTTTHQELVNLTVNLMKRDLPQAQANQRQPQGEEAQ